MRFLKTERVSLSCEITIANTQSNMAKKACERMLQMHVCMHSYMHTNTPMDMQQIHLHTYANACTYTHAYTCTHTHTHTNIVLNWYGTKLRTFMFAMSHFIMFSASLFPTSSFSPSFALSSPQTLDLSSIKWQYFHKTLKLIWFLGYPWKENS